MLSFLKKLSSPDEENIGDAERAFNDVKAHIEANPLRKFRGVKSEDPLVVTTSKHARFVRLSLQTEVSFHLDAIEVYTQNGQDAARNCRTIISSIFNDEEKHDGRGALNGIKNGGCGFHTKREINPWLIVDLGSIQVLNKIVIFNREGEFYTRALSLKIEISTDLQNWELIHDNWGFIKYYKDGKYEENERAFLYAGILDPGPASAYLQKLKSEGSEDNALKFHEQINQLVAPMGVAFGPHGFMQTFELKSSTEKKKIFSELSKLLALINVEFGIPAFVFAGTLLGLVRDKQLIGHDDDVDICYVSKEVIESEILKEREQLIAFLQSKGCKITPSGIAHYWCTTSGGLNLDIFTGFIEEEKCSLNPLGRAGLYASDILPVKTELVDGVPIYFPNNPEPILILNYGTNWRAPDPLWTFDWTNVQRDYKFLYF